jgi:hypothetical protein
LSKIVIDSTGDGDMFVAAGAEYDDHLDPKYRTAWLAIVFWLTNVDLKKLDAFKASQPKKYEELMQELMNKGGYPSHFKGLLKNQDNCIWFHAFQRNADGRPSNAKDVEELTRVDVNSRKRALITYEFLKKYVPGFEKSYIMQTSPQLGTQGGRRVVGEYTLTEKDMESDEVFDDTIAVFANNDNHEISAKHPTLCIPYRCLVPRKKEGLLVACRAFSSADAINHHFNIIPYCISFGQAAGTAAAIAAQAGIQPRHVDYKTLQDKLRKQGVLLPGEKV